MLYPNSYEELATILEGDQRLVLFFKADWCPDCQFIYPALPEIEAAFPDMNFVSVDRDDFMALAEQWQIFGIPSLVVVQDGQEQGRLVNKLRKTKQEICDFLASLA